MKRNLLFFLAAFISLVTVSCNKESFSSQSTEERLHGVWIFDRVKLKGASGPNANVTENFAHSSIRFNEDYSLSYYDAQKEVLSSGEWEIYQYIEFDEDDNDETIRDLYIFVLDTTLNQYETIIWSDVTVRRSKLTATENLISGGRYELDMKRIEKK